VKRFPDDTSARFLPSVLDAPEPGFRYMKRRRRDRRDGEGDPLGGLALLFPIGLAFAVAFLLAAFSGLGITDLLVADTFTLVTDPGGETMRVVVKSSEGIEELTLEEVTTLQGVGTLVGSFYRLADGTIVWVPVPAGGESPATPQPTPVPTPSAYEQASPAPLTPTPTPTDSAAPDSSIVPTGELLP
jgi:hypothetical protein